MKISTSKVFASALVAIMFSVFSTSNSKAAEALKIGPAEISFNAGYMSNYVWRGVDQNSGDGSASFGVDASLPYGIYLGSWTASVDLNGSNQELDFYGGIAKSFGMATVDIGYIAYTYPGHTDNVATNFGEFYGKLNLAPEKSPLSFDISYYELDTKPEALLGTGEYIEYGVSYAAPSDISLAVSYGDYEKSNTVTTVSAGKSFAGIDFTLAYIDTNYDAAGYN